MAAAIAPKGRKDPIEDRKLFVMVDEKRAAGVIHLVSCGEIDVPQRFHHIQHAAWLDIDTCAPEETSEKQQVVDERRHLGA